jgi:hypothetical protein
LMRYGTNMDRLIPVPVMETNGRKLPLTLFGRFGNPKN